MSVKQGSFFCPVCKEQRLFISQGMNHTPHVLLMIFTCFIWGVVWLIISLLHDYRYACSKCGFSDSKSRLAVPTNYPGFYQGSATSQAPRRDSGVVSFNAPTDTATSSEGPNNVPPNTGLIGGIFSKFKALPIGKKVLVGFGIYVGAMAIFMGVRLIVESPSVSRDEGFRKKSTASKTLTPTPTPERPITFSSSTDSSSSSSAGAASAIKSELFTIELRMANLDRKMNRLAGREDSPEYLEALLEYGQLQSRQASLQKRLSRLR